MGKPEGKKEERRWVDNIKMDFRTKGVVWTGLIWLRKEASVGSFLKR
jgi:hypothetical protein